MKRIIIKREGRRPQKFVVVRPPYPNVGDAINVRGEEWQVSKVEGAPEAIEIKFHKVRA